MAREDMRYPGGAVVCKRASNSEDFNDIIDALPDDLLDFILGRLPMHDVVRTRILSKRWSNCWARHGKLDFGADFVKKYIKGEYKDDKYVEIVDSLLLQQKSPVLKVDLYLVRGLNSLCWSSHLYRWINFLWEHDIRDLTIHGRGQIINVNASLFKCSSLRNLKLASCCVLGPSKGFNGFPYVTNLEIEGCIMPKTEWEATIDSPSLQTLRVNCTACGDRVQGGGDHVEISRDPIQVGGSQIKSLIVASDEFPVVCLKESPNLTDAIIKTMVVLPESPKETFELYQSAKLFPRIKTLTLAGITLTSLACDALPLRLPTMLRDLEHLELYFIDMYSLMELSYALYEAHQVCSHSSSVQVISLFMNYVSHIQHTVYFLTAQQTEGIMNGIRAVTFIDLQGLALEVDFIRTIIDCCPKLESIQVAPDSNDDFDKERFFAEMRSLHGSLVSIESAE